MARWIVLAGAVALFVIGYFATFATQSANDGWGRRNVHAIAATLQQRADAAIVKLGAEQWASVVVDGQTAILNGEAPTESDRQDAIDAVRAAEWSGGKWIGGITVVKNATTLAKALTPYEWVAQLGERGRVRLSGYVPGQKHRRALRAEAQRLFPQGIEDQMVVAQGAPTGPWTDTAIWALAQLSRLSSGEAHFKDKVVLIRGAAPDATVQGDIQQAAEAKIGKPYRGQTDIRTVGFDASAATTAEPAVPPLPTPAPAPLTATAPSVTPPPVAATPAPHPAAPAPAASAPPASAPPVTPARPQLTAPTPSATTPSATAQRTAPSSPPPAAPPPRPAATPLTTPDTAPTPPAQHDDGLDCQKLVDKLMANNTIAFAAGSAEIRSVAHDMLNHLAQSAQQCPLKIRITGHTDTTPTDTADANLSQQRADAVASYLVRRGVARKRVLAIGAGTEQPVGDNATSVGQAKNRRIEITVTN